MAGETEQFETCGACGATIYPEHLDKHLAAREAGVLLCAHCLRDRQARGGSEAPLEAPPPPGEPIALVDYDESDVARPSAAIRSFGGGPGGMTTASLSTEKLRRPLLRGSPNATRCRTFHCKLADGAIMHMNEQVNEWADQQTDIEIKFATSCIGVVEGKHTDPHLILTVFY